MLVGLTQQRTPLNYLLQGAAGWLVLEAVGLGIYGAAALTLDLPAGKLSIVELAVSLVMVVAATALGLAAYVMLTRQAYAIEDRERKLTFAVGAVQMALAVLMLGNLAWTRPDVVSIVLTAIVIAAVAISGFVAVSFSRLTDD